MPLLYRDTIDSMLMYLTISLLNSFINSNFLSSDYFGFSLLQSRLWIKTVLFIPSKSLWLLFIFLPYCTGRSYWYSKVMNNGSANELSCIFLSFTGKVLNIWLSGMMLSVSFLYIPLPDKGCSFSVLVG